MTDSYIGKGIRNSPVRVWMRSFKWKMEQPPAPGPARGWDCRKALGMGAGGEPGARLAQGACGPALGILRLSSAMINYTCHTRINSPFEKIRAFQVKSTVTTSPNPTPSSPSPEATTKDFFPLEFTNIQRYLKRGSTLLWICFPFLSGIVLHHAASCVLHSICFQAPCE